MPRRKKPAGVVSMPVRRQPPSPPPPPPPPIVPPPPVVPARVAPIVDTSHIAAPRRPNSKGLNRLTEGVVHTYAAPVLREFFQSLLEGVTKGDTTVMRMAAEVYGLVQSKGGFVINNNINNTQNNVTLNTRKFDNLVRAIEAEEKGTTIDV